MYATESTKLIELLKEVDSVALTADLWTSIAHHAYLGVTAHFVTQDGILHTKLPDCIEMAADQHTAEDIAALLTERFTFWGINSKVFAAVSDNGLNMVRAIRDILKIHVFFGCFAHTVNLAVEKGYKCARVSPLLTLSPLSSHRNIMGLSQARHVVERFTRSSKATYLLRTAQTDAGKAPAEVWNLRGTFLLGGRRPMR